MYDKIVLRNEEEIMKLEKITKNLKNGCIYGIRKYYTKGHIKVYGRPRLEYNQEYKEYVIYDNEQEFTINDNELVAILSKYNLYKMKEV